MSGPFTDPHQETQPLAGSPSFLECLNDSPWLWWPIALPPRSQCLSVGQLLKAALFYAALPFVLSLFAMLGAVYVPSSILLEGLMPNVVIGTATLAGVWLVIFLVLLSVPFCVWNGRAKRLQRLSQVRQAGQQMSGFGFPTAVNQGQSAWQRQTVSNAPLYHQWTSFTEAVAAPFSWAGLSMVLLGFPLLIMALSFLLLPSLLKGVTMDLTRMQPALAAKPSVVDVAPLDFEATQRNQLAIDRRVCCLNARHSDLRKENDNPIDPVNRPLSMMLPSSGWYSGQMGRYTTVCSQTGKCLFFEKVDKGQLPHLIQLKAAKRDRRGVVLQYRSLHPDYGLDQHGLGAVLATTPEDIPWMELPGQALSQFNRLLNKFFLLSNRSHLYFLQSERWHAYQLGHPEQDGWVQVILFDHHQGWLALNFGLKPGAKEAFSQQEIQQILASIEPVSDAELAEEHLDREVSLKQAANPTTPLRSRDGKATGGEASQGQQASGGKPEERLPEERLFDQTGVDGESLLPH